MTLQESSSGPGVQSEALAFLSFFADLPDPRQAGKVIYPRLSRSSGCACWQCWQARKTLSIELLRRFLPFKDGTPSHDQLCDLFAMIDATHFQPCFADWVAKMLGVSADVVAIDGKTLRRSADKRRGKAAIHMVSAFAARQRLVLGQVKVEDKSNEIIAIPALLDMLEIEGAVAMGCQRDIAQKVIEKKADYILALKGNQGSLREDVEVFAA